MGRVQVGLPSFQGDIAKYEQRFDMVEIRADVHASIKPSTLRGWRKSVNPSFTFSVVLPRVVGELLHQPKSDAKETDNAVSSGLKLATSLEARCVVLETPAELRPTKANRERLSAMLTRLKRPGSHVCWEPRGVWEAAEVSAIAKQLGVFAIVDLSQDDAPAGQSVYTRIRALGQNGVSQKAVQRIAERLAGRREAWVVVEDRPSASRVKRELGAIEAEVVAPAIPMVVRPAAGRLRAEDEEQ